MHTARSIRSSHSARATAWLLLAVVASLLGACSHVAPYEREHLAHPAMDTAARERAEARFHGHVYDAREGAGSSGDVAGGGCGCN